MFDGGSAPATAAAGDLGLLGGGGSLFRWTALLIMLPAQFQHAACPLPLLVHLDAAAQLVFRVLLEECELVGGWNVSPKRGIKA